MLTRAQGCGRGVDVVLLAGAGVDAFGLEISAAAVAAAREYAAPRMAGVAGSARFEQGDFYADEWVARMGVALEGGFDYVYDYTVRWAYRDWRRGAVC